MTRDEFITQLTNDIIAVVPTNITMTSVSNTTAFNAILGTMYTTEPTKKPTIKQITQIEF